MITKRPIRLCVVSPAHSSAQTGGAEYQMDLLIAELLATGRYEIHYLARLAVPGEAGGYQVHRIGHGEDSPRFGYAVDFLPLYRALRELRPDVIYQRVACGYTGIAACYAKRARIPMIWHVAHDSDVLRRSVIDGRNPVRKLLEKGAIRYGIRHATRIVTQTQSQSVLMQREFGRSADAVIANFHPLPREAVRKSPKFTVVWIGGLKPWKQPDAFVRLARACVDLPDVEFLLVGPRSESTGRGAAWEAGLMADVGATPNLRYLGGLPQADVNALLARSHVYVSTSLYEGFPNTFIQAWMRDVVVVSLTVDPDGVLEHGGVGVLARDEAGLVTAIHRLAGDEAARERYTVRAGVHAREQHSLDNVKRIAALLEGGDRPTAA